MLLRPALPSPVQPTCVTIARPDKLTFSTEEDFQAHVAACEDDANADLLQDKCEPGSAVDKTAPSYDPDDPSTWQPPTPLPRGDARLCYRTFVCHCHGASRAQLPKTDGLTNQDAFLAKFNAADGMGRCAAVPCTPPACCPPAALPARTLPALQPCPPVCCPLCSLASPSSSPAAGGLQQPVATCSSSTTDIPGPALLIRSKKRLYMEGSHKNGCSWRLNASTGMDGSITATQSGAHATDGDCPCGSMAHARRLSPATKDWIANLLDLCVSKDRIYEFCLHPERMPKGVWAGVGGGGGWMSGWVGSGWGSGSEGAHARGTSLLPMPLRPPPPPAPPWLQVSLALPLARVPVGCRPGPSWAPLNNGTALLPGWTPTTRQPSPSL